MPAQIQILDAAGLAIPDLTQLATTDTGTPGAPLDVLIRNAGDEPAVEGQVRILARLDNLSPWRADGLLPLDEGWVEIAVDGGPFLPLGAGRLVAIPDLDPGEEIPAQLRQHPPSGGADHTFDYQLQALTGGSAYLPGIHLPTGAGVVLPFHDSTALAWWEPPQAVAGAGAGEVDLSAWSWFAARRFWAVPATTVVLDNLDTNADPLAVGEEYIALLSAAPDGTVTVTKGTKGAAPLDESARPALPTGELSAFWVSRDDTGAVAITAAYQLGFFAATTSSTTVHLGSGSALLDGRGPVRRAGQDAGLPPNATSIVHQLPLGGHAVTDATLPDPAPTANPGALALYQATTDAATVTELVDLRRWVGARSHPLEFHLPGALVVDAVAHAVLPPGRWHLLPTGALSVFFEDPGIAAGGATVFDVEVRDGGGVWASLFPAQTGTVPDHGESVAANATDSNRDGRPEVLTLDGPALVRLRVAALPDTPAPAPSGGLGELGVWG